jgi:alpha-tubulin suppressor-like RCC1 family protein
VEANLKLETPCLLLGGKQIRKVSCGNGYFLMLNTFGSIFSMGYNHFGQLGIGNYNSGEENMSAS